MEERVDRFHVADCYVSLHAKAFNSMFACTLVTEVICTVLEHCKAFSKVKKVMLR